MSKPTIVACAGAWHSPAIYDKTFSVLQSHGYETIGQALPSAGSDPPISSFGPDVEAIRKTLTKLIVGEGKDVVLVVHSFSGMTGSEAPVGLGKRQRSEKGLEGGVVRMVFFAAFVPVEGFNPVAVMQQYPPWMHVDEEKGVITLVPEEVTPLFYNDLPPEEAAEWASRLVPQSLGPYSSTTTYAAWRYIPSTFVIPKDDQSVPNPEAFMEMFIQAARAVEPTALDVVEKIAGGHCAMISQPQEVANVFRRAAGEAV